MTKPIRILLQTTIPFAEDDWHIGRFSLLRAELSAMKHEAGNQICEVTARNREADSAGNDPVLANLDKTDFDELWLFAIDTGDGLSVPDCQGITRFRQRGGGIMATRDHQDLEYRFVRSAASVARTSFTRKTPSPTPLVTWPTIKTRHRSHGPTITRAGTATIKGSRLPTHTNFCSAMPRPVISLSFFLLIHTKEQ